jgi:hypothetical protein
VTTDEVWTRNCIFTSNYSVIAISHSLQFSTSRTKSPQPAFFTGRCLLTNPTMSSVPVLNFLPPGFHSLIAPTALLITSRHGPHRKHRSSVAVCGPLSSNGRCRVVSRSFPRNGCTEHNIYPLSICMPNFTFLARKQNFLHSTLTVTIFSKLELYHHTNLQTSIRE